MDFNLVDALVISLVGVTVVMSILAIIAVCIILASKVIRAIERQIAKKAKVAPAPESVTAPVAAPVSADNSEVELIGTDEKTAAVIMAIVSQKSGIPVNRLSFKSIRLLDNEKKGAGKK